MIGLNMFKGKSWVLLGFFLSVACVPLMKTIEHSSLDGTTLTSEYSVRGGTTPGPYYPYYPSSEYAALPIDPAVTWMTSRDTPLSSAAVLFHPNGTLELSGSDQNQNSPRDIWDTFTDIMDFANTLVRGQLVTEEEISFYRMPGRSSILREENGNPEIANVTSPTAALDGTDRILYSRNQTVEKLPDPAAAKKDSKRVKILASTVGILGVLLIIGVTIFFLWRYEKIRQWLWACARCGLCCRRPKPRCEFKFPGDTPVRTETEDGGVELEVEKREPRCHCAVSCGMSFRGMTTTSSIKHTCSIYLAPSKQSIGTSLATLSLANKQGMTTRGLVHINIRFRCNCWMNCCRKPKVPNCINCNSLLLVFHHQSFAQFPDCDKTT